MPERDDTRFEWSRMPVSVALLVGLGDIFLGAVQLAIAVIVGSPLSFILGPSGACFTLIGIAQIARALRQRSRRSGQPPD